MVESKTVCSDLQLRDPSLFREQCFLGGKWTGTAATPIYNPHNEEVLGRVPNLGAHECSQAIKAAQLAFKEWSRYSALERSSLLGRFAQLCRESVEDLARILTLEQGKPLAEARAEVAYGTSFLQWFAEEARRIYGDVIPSASRDSRIVVLRQPVGVVAAITPWNFPNAMLTRKAGAALAAGCSIVIKPAPETPFSALALAALAERAGIPPGVFSVITGDAAAIGSEMTSNPIVRKLSFTGSTPVGRMLLRDCAATVKKVSLELGGNAPFVVFDDADVEQAVRGLIGSKFRNAGQTCVCPNRVYVQETVYEIFALKLVEAVRRLRVGNGLAEGVTIGPLIHQRAVAKVSEHVDDAVRRGAIVLTGGKRHALGGNFFEPTVLAEVSADARCCQEETFGPLAALVRFRTEQEVVELCNATEAGLAAYVYTRDLSRAWRVAEALEYGMVGVNEAAISVDAAPFGGVKQSGLGREGSKYGIEEYSEMKYLCLGI
ncbi:MAG: NAD-dependent succinate-semialdehyde dehydrogenase [Acidobacteriota bacterium]